MKIGRLFVRTSSRNLSSWGWERMRWGGLRIWSWSNSGDLILASYQTGLTWRWSLAVGRDRKGAGAQGMWGKAGRDLRMKLFLEGNPYVSRPRWWHALWQPARKRTGQWNDMLRLPFGFHVRISYQDYHRRPGWR